MAVNRLAQASVANYVENVRVGTTEVTVTGTVQGQSVTQTIPIDFPAVVLFDPATRNLYTIKIDGLRPNSRLVAVVESIT